MLTEGVKIDQPEGIPESYTRTASFEKITQAFSRPLPQSPLVFFPALSLPLFFARAPLSERLEQASRNLARLFRPACKTCFD